MTFPSLRPAQPTQSPARGRRAVPTMWHQTRSDLYALRAQLDGPATPECRCERIPSVHSYAAASISIRDQRGGRGKWLSTDTRLLGGPDRCRLGALSGSAQRREWLRADHFFCPGARGWQLQASSGATAAGCRLVSVVSGRLTSTNDVQVSSIPRGALPGVHRGLTDHGDVPVRPAARVRPDDHPALARRDVLHRHEHRHPRRHRPRRARRRPAAWLDEVVALKG
jgi:hypothetical protein